MKAHFEVVKVTDLFIVLIDLDNGGRSVTNDAENVVQQLQKNISGGIGNRVIYYRDTTGRYDRLTVDKAGKFVGFAPCTNTQQTELAKMVEAGH